MKKLSLQEIQAVSFDILKYFAAVCEQHGLTYYLAYGTLLGAIRHEGFIPWDDDVDVVMPRPDYEKLLKIFKDTDVYALKSCLHCKGYLLPYAKVVDKRTFISLGDEADNMGLGIDVFPLDGIQNDLDHVRKVYARYNERFMQRLVRFSNFYYSDAKTIKGKIKKLIGEILKNTGVLNRIARGLSGNPMHCSYDNGEYVAVMVGEYSQKLRVFERSWFVPVKQGKVNDEVFYIPEKYDDVLKVQYGNYMELPSEEDRVSTHTYAIYLKNDQ